jgi:hypothetical protein
MDMPSFRPFCRVNIRLIDMREKYCPADGLSGVYRPQQGDRFVAKVLAETRGLAKTSMRKTRGA